MEGIVGVVVDHGLVYENKVGRGRNWMGQGGLGLFAVFFSFWVWFVLEGWVSSVVFAE